MTGDEGRTADLKLDFLDPDKTYTATIFSDDAAKGLNGWCPAKKEIKKIRHGVHLNIEMVEAGGFVIVLDPEYPSQ